jgi:hypothetical protein
MPRYDKTGLHRCKPVLDLLFLVGLKYVGVLPERTRLPAETVAARGNSLGRIPRSIRQSGIAVQFGHER